MLTIDNSLLDLFTTTSVATSRGVGIASNSVKSIGAKLGIVIATHDQSKV